jgi:hypothetical protein
MDPAVGSSIMSGESLWGKKKLKRSNTYRNELKACPSSNMIQKGHNFLKPTQPTATMKK